jgi:hypothetical protein
VLGRIAELYGASDIALESYARVKKATRPDPLDVWHLADKRTRLVRAARRAP